MGKVLPLRRVAGTTEELTDEALVAACAAGDSAALAALYDRHHRSVHRVLHGLVSRDPELVQDLLQATFMEVFTSAARFKGKSAARTWIFGIGINLARTALRKETRKLKLAQAVREVHNYTKGPSAEAQVSHRQQLGIIRRVLAEMPAGNREAFVLCDIEEVRGVDAALMLDVKVGTLYRRLHEARTELRHALEAEAGS